LGSAAKYATKPCNSARIRGVAPRPQLEEMHLCHGLLRIEGTGDQAHGEQWNVNNSLSDPRRATFPKEASLLSIRTVFADIFFFFGKIRYFQFEPCPSILYTAHLLTHFKVTHLFLSITTCVPLQLSYKSLCLLKISKPCVSKGYFSQQGPRTLKSGPQSAARSYDYQPQCQSQRRKLWCGFGSVSV
jgi:hypothetical protein